MSGSTRVHVIRSSIAKMLNISIEQAKSNMQVKDESLFNNATL